MIPITLSPNRRTRLFKWMVKLMIARQEKGGINESMIYKMRAFSARYGLPMPSGAVSTPVKIAGYEAAWIKMPELRADRVLLYFHGGGYVNSSPKMHAQMIARMASTLQARALAVEYPLAPEHPYPAALEYAREAYQAVLDGGITADQVVVAGDSAGGGLALALALLLRDLGLPLPRGLVLFSPWVDLTMTLSRARERTLTDVVLSADLLSMMGRLYAGDYALDDPLISPLYADLRGLPPIYIQAAEHEILIDEITVLAEKLKAAGSPVCAEVYGGMWHVWQLYPPNMVRESGIALEGLRQWSNSVWGG